MTVRFELKHSLRAFMRGHSDTVDDTRSWRHSR